MATLCVEPMRENKNPTGYLPEVSEPGRVE
jgi:hypothetical protein